jgi:tetratricopeptide (TPR) repeat protein
VKNIFGQVLISSNQHEKARLALLEALKIFQKFKEEVSEDGMILLNNLSVCHAELEMFDKAEMYLKQAIEIAKKLSPPVEDVSAFEANLGMLFLKQKLTENALNQCKLAWKTAIMHKNKDSQDAAEKCLDQVKKAMAS